LFLENGDLDYVLEAPPTYCHFWRDVVVGARVGGHEVVPGLLSPLHEALDGTASCAEMLSLSERLFGAIRRMEVTICSGRVVQLVDDETRLPPRRAPLNRKWKGVYSLGVDRQWHHADAEMLRPTRVERWVCEHGRALVSRIVSQ